MTVVRTLAWDNRGTVFFLLFAFCFHNVGGTREVIAQLSGGNARFPGTGIKVRNARQGRKSGNGEASFRRSYHM